MPYLMAEGALASCIAAVVSNPFETTKVRLQLQGELQKRGEYAVIYRGTLHGMMTIAQNEGLFALQKGLGASMVHQTILNGLRLGLYGPVCTAVKDYSGTSGFAANFLSGGICGAIGAAVGSPVFLAKTRLQSQSNAVAIGTQYDYRGLTDALRRIYSSGGVRGLFHGVENAVARTCMGSAVQLSTYDEVKRNVRVTFDLDETDVRLHFLASLAGGLCVALSMNPFDVLMSRAYNSNAAHQDHIFKAMKAVLRTEGFAGLYKGWTALWARIGPHTVCTFLALEQMKQLRPSFAPFESIVD